MKRTLSARTICLLVVISLTLLAAACFLRAFYGFDWSDETYYTALPYRYAVGDRLFSDGWEIHQLSAMFTMPLIRLFLLFSGGNTDGIMLCMRLLFVLFQYGTALMVFFSFRRRYGIAVAALIASICLMFTHFALPNFSYDTLVLLFSFWSISFVVRARDAKKSFVSACLSGLSYAFAVQSYPQYALSFPIFLLFWLFPLRRARATGDRTHGLTGFVTGIGIAVVLFLVFVMTHSSLGELVQNLPYLLSDPTHERQSVFLLALEYCKVIVVVLGIPFVIALLLFAVTLAQRFLPDGKSRARLNTLLLPAAGLVALLLVIRMLRYDIWDYAKLNFLAMPLACVCPTLLLLLKKEDLSLPTLVFLLGAVLSIGVQVLGSNMGIYASSFPLLLCSVASLLAVRDVLGYADAGGAAVLPRAIWLLTALTLVLGISFLRLNALYYTDGTIDEQTSVLSTGPAKGIHATPKSAAQYETIIREITENIGSGPVLFVRCLPFGYLCNGVNAGTPSVWAVDPNTARVIQYYQMHPEHIPETIFVMNYDVGNSNQQRNADDLVASFPNSDSYTVTGLHSCILYQRTDH